MLRIMIVIFTLQKLSSVMEHYSNVVLMLLLLSLCFATIQGFFLKVSADTGDCHFYQSMPVFLYVLNKKKYFKKTVEQMKKGPFY